MMKGIVQCGMKWLDAKSTEKLEIAFGRMSMKSRVIWVVVEGHHSTFLVPAVSFVQTERAKKQTHCHKRLRVILRRILGDPQVHTPVGTRDLQGGQQPMPFTPIPQPHSNLLQSWSSFHNINHRLQRCIPVDSDNEMLDSLGNRFVRQRVELRSIHPQSLQILTARLDGTGRVAGKVGSGKRLK